ncbi:MAG: type IV toxin-antitoxin system AbiEi family antitoxin [Bacteroidota bacterium]
MSTVNQTKINQLLLSLPSGVVMQSLWLVKQGYSLDLQKRYRQSKWLESIGHGAMVRAGNKVEYQGAIYAFQKQSNVFIHPGGRTALSLLGKSHYLELSGKQAVIFGGKDERLPAWFRKHDWGLKINYHQTSFLPADAGLTEIEMKNFSIKVSDTTRAIMECLYLTPKNQELMECYQLMEGLNNLRPAHVHSMLEKCQSIKVKRLFLYMAEKAGHAWFQDLDTKTIDIGTGKRSIVKQGVYIPKYQITVPKEFEADGKGSI